MTQKEKELLIKDICGRLFYRVFVEYDYGDGVKRVTEFHGNYLYLMMTGNLQWKDFKPYLRTMSNMTEEEKEEYCNLQDKFLLSSQYPVTDAYEMFDWLNKKMFDYRGLIPKGLALEAPKDMYNTKTE